MYGGLFKKADCIFPTFFQDGLAGLLKYYTYPWLDLINAVDGVEEERNQGQALGQDPTRYKRAQKAMRLKQPENSVTIKHSNSIKTKTKHTKLETQNVYSWKAHKHTSPIHILLIGNFNISWTIEIIFKKNHITQYIEYIEISEEP